MRIFSKLHNMANGARNYKLKCVNCKKEYTEEQTYTQCPKCGDSLDVIYNYDSIGERFNRHVFKSARMRVMKYLDFYPLNDLRKVITLYEGGTPCYKAKNLGRAIGMKKVFIKNEGLNPTGAFKDRGSTIELTKSLEMNKNAVCCASTGNMAGSVSAYAAKANLPCYVLIPEGTPIGKMSQTLSYGARVIQIRGTYDEAAKLTQKIAKEHNFYLAGDYCFRSEGQKSCAYEIVEQLGWRKPDKVIVPIGCGTNGSAIWKGFKEFKIFDFIDELPEMIGVQAAGANTIVKAFKSNKKRWKIVEKPQTVASAIAVGNPLDGTKILNALRDSKGGAAVVKDEQILEAEKLLAKTESVFVEPSAATTLAALINMLKSGEIDKSEEVVLVLTGAGLKDPISALKVLPSPPSTEPDLKEITKFLDYGYYKVYAEPMYKSKLLFKKAPNYASLKQSIKKEFDVRLSREDTLACMDIVKSFFEKGKLISKVDLKFILEDLLKKPRIKQKALDVVNYYVKINKKKKAQASIEVDYLGRKISAFADGVGPFDAIINAVRKVMKHNEVNVRLVDYSVDINSKGSDATVNVKMTLMDEKDNKVIAMGTSPDIIAASVDAFEEGYNILYMKNKDINKKLRGI